MVERAPTPCASWHGPAKPLPLPRKIGIAAENPLTTKPRKTNVLEKSGFGGKIPEVLWELEVAGSNPVAPTTPDAVFTSSGANAAHRAGTWLPRAAIPLNAARSPQPWRAA